jgi:hypothetical protein
MRFPHFVLAIVVGLSPWILQGSLLQDIGADIKHAENLYYQAKYMEADTLLASLSDRLNGSGASAGYQVQVKMLMGLTRFVLGNEPDARNRFLELCVINPSYVLDERQFAPKVVAFYKGVQADCANCRKTCFQASSLAASGDLQAASRTKVNVESPSCSCSTWASKPDNPGFLHANDLLAQGKPAEALKEFKGLTQTFPQSQPLRDAANSLQKQIDDSVQSGVVEWRGFFLGRRFEQAAAVFERIQPIAAESSGDAREAFRQVTMRYQTTFQDLLTSFAAACAQNNEVSLTAVRTWGKSLDPNRTIKPDVLDRIQQGCTRPPAATALPAATR